MKTLLNYPDSRLGRLATDLHTDDNYRPGTDDFYFERNVAAFSDIIEFYRSGELHMNETRCGGVMAKVRQASWSVTVL